MHSTPPVQWIGQRIKRREDVRLVQGRGTYVDDVTLPGMLHMMIKRSDVAHGRILSIDAGAALAIEGVEAVVTGAQLAEVLGPMPVGTPFPSPVHRAVAIDVVRYVGEAVAVVVARDRYVARDAIDAISVAYDTLPAVTDPEAAMSGQPAVLHDEFPHNVAVRLERGSGVTDDAAAALARIRTALDAADVVVRQRMVNQRLVPNALEPRGVVAHFDVAAGMLTVWSSTQNPHLLRSLLAEVLALGHNQVRAIAPDVGGGFGAKINAYPEDYVAAALSLQLGAPIKWIEERTEAFVSTTHGRDIVGYVEVGAKRDGRIDAIKLDLIADIGAYNMLRTAAVPTHTLTMASSTYDIPLVHATLSEAFTNKTPTDAYRGAGRPEATYFVERALDMVARKLGLDPADVRRRNFIRRHEFPFRTQVGAVYDSGDYDAVLDAALQLADWERLKEERDTARSQGRLVGLGLAMYVEVCGIGPHAWEHSEVRVERDGRVTATTGASPHGQGNETTFSQILADQFGIPMEHIRIVYGDTGVVKQGTGTFGSRSQAVGGTALYLAAEKVKRKMQAFAATMLDLEQAQIAFGNGVLTGPGGACVKTFAEVAAFAYSPAVIANLEIGLSEQAFFAPSGNTYPAGCHICMVEIDRDTGEVKLVKVVEVDDAGNLINPLIVEGQIHGGLAQGIGQALLEGALYDDHGQLLNGSWLDYAMPRAADFPRFELASVITPTPLNPLGCKGVGEAGTLGSTPSVVSAVVDALGEFGVTHLDMPIRPETVWRLIHRCAQTDTP